MISSMIVWLRDIINQIGTLWLRLFAASAPPRPLCSYEELFLRTNNLIPVGGDPPPATPTTVDEEGCLERVIQGIEFEQL